MQTAAALVFVLVLVLLLMTWDVGALPPCASVLVLVVMSAKRCVVEIAVGVGSLDAGATGHELERGGAARDRKSWIGLVGHRRYRRHRRLGSSPRPSVP